MQKKILSSMLAIVLLILSTAFVPAGAVTVEKDGKQYTFFSHTPTTGDCKVLTVRVGFADYPVDDENYPADSEETLMSCFDGSEGSISAFYEASSYGRLHLSCDEIFTYTYPGARSECSADRLPETALRALEDKIDFDRYDSDNDGYLDFVIFDFSGPLTDWGSDWWPHVKNADVSDVGGKNLALYTLLQGKASTVVHEFGHLLGAPDYYSQNSDSTNAIMTYDMMSNHTGDHDGFTKWFYGWLGDDEIAFVDRSVGDTTVKLAPFETPLGDGKKIAVVAPSIDRSKGFNDEFFVVEYDSGKGNNAEVFSEKSLRPGFRIFHVRAEASYEDEPALASFWMDNDKLRDNLIHSIKSELLDPDMFSDDDAFFREGDQLTPNGYPNTGFAFEEVYNGRFTGVSFTDFVTGDEPSFRVSFTDAAEQDRNVNFSLSYEDLDAEMELTLTTDKPTVVRNTRIPDNYQYAPYLIDDKGVKLILDINNADNGPYTYSLGYHRPDPTVRPMTEYTLVIPEGLFLTGYHQNVPEYRATLTTPGFIALTVIGRISAEADQKVHSNIFPVTDNSFGMIRVPYSGTGNCLFTEYNLAGEPISTIQFELPPLNPSGDPKKAKVFGCRAYQLNDGSFALDLPMYDSSCFVKIDRAGKALSRVYSVDWSLVQNYTGGLFYVNYDLYKGGLTKCFNSSDYTSMGQLIIDFESEPRLVETDAARKYFNLDGETYAVMIYGSDRNLRIYDKSDKPVGSIPFRTGNSLLSVMKQDGQLLVVYYVFDREADTTTVYADAYSDSLELRAHRDITANALHITEYSVWNRAHVNDAGYYLEYNDEESEDLQSTVIAYDKNWNYLGVIEFDNTRPFTFAGACGLTQQFENRYGSLWNVISRFNIGDFEIIPKVRLLGDVDGDGGVTVLDATAIQRKLAALYVASYDEALADVDGDGTVTILDATAIQRYLAGLSCPEGIAQALA